MHRDTNSAIQKLIEGTEELLRRTASVGEEKIETNQSRLKRHWHNAASRAHDLQDAAGAGVRTFSKRADGVVHRHAWESIGIAALVGAVIAGCLLSQKKRR